MKAGLIVAPVVALYSPIVLLNSFATNRFPPDNAMKRGKSNPETKELLIVAPVVALYSPIVLFSPFVTKSLPRANARTGESFKPTAEKDIMMVDLEALMEGRVVVGALLG